MLPWLGKKSLLAWEQQLVLGEEDHLLIKNDSTNDQAVPSLNILHGLMCMF